MIEKFLIKDWKFYQHYKDRNPPWIKLHYELLTSKEWVMLSNDSRCLQIVSMLMASRNDGAVPNDPEYIKRVAYLDNTPDFTELVKCGFLIPVTESGETVSIKEYLSSINLIASDSKCLQVLTNVRPETETETYKEYKEYKEETEKPMSTQTQKKETNKKETHEEYLQTWNEFATKHKLTTITKLSATRNRSINLRIKEGIDLKAVLEAIPEQDFLLGKTKLSNWKVDFGYIFANDTNWLKILELGFKHLNNKEGDKQDEETYEEREERYKELLK